MAALGLLRAGYNLTDSFWVGRMGPAPLAALGGSAFGWWIILLACDLPATGAHSLVARHAGAGARERIGQTLVQAALAGLAVGALLAALYPARHLYFDLLGFTGAEREHGASYLGASLLGAASLAIYAVIGGVFRGLGRTRTALAITALTLVANAVLDPLLMWGLGPIPALGIAGAAWATALANVLGAALGLWLLREHRPRIARPDLRAILALGRIGLPPVAAGIGFSLCYVVLGRLIHRFGPEHMGALGVGHRLEGLAFLICTAFGVGAATMVGQHLGAGSSPRARESARVAARLCSYAMLPASVLLFALARPLFELFTGDPATIEAGVVYLRIQTLVFVPMALETVYESAFTGAGDTVGASVIEIVFTVLRIPAAWWLAVELGWGIEGVWIAIATSTAIKGVSMWLWWRRGRWAAGGR